LFSIISLKPCFNGILYHLFMSRFHLVRNWKSLTLAVGLVLG
jgi:hypothetical protein